MFALPTAIIQKMNGNNAGRREPKSGTGKAKGIITVSRLLYHR